MSSRFYNVDPTLENYWRGVNLVMPNGNYMFIGARLESSILSDDREHRVLTIRVDVPA